LQRGFGKYLLLVLHGAKNALNKLRLVVVLLRQKEGKDDVLTLGIRLRVRASKLDPRLLQHRVPGHFASGCGCKLLGIAALGAVGDDHGGTGHGDRLAHHPGLFQHLNGSGRNGDEYVRAQLLCRNEVGEAIGTLSFSLVGHVMGLGEGRTQVQIHDRSHGAGIGDLKGGGGHSGSHARHPQTGE